MASHRLVEARHASDAADARHRIDGQGSDEEFGGTTTEEGGKLGGGGALTEERVNDRHGKADADAGDATQGRRNAGEVTEALGDRGKTTGSRSEVCPSSHAIEEMMSPANRPKAAE